MAGTARLVRGNDLNEISEHHQATTINTQSYYTPPNGLSTKEVKERLRVDGYNELPSSNRRGTFAIALVLALYELDQQIHNSVKNHSLGFFPLQPVARINQHRGMKPVVVQFQIQGVLPAQMIDHLLAGSSFGHFRHELEQRHPAKQHRIDRRTTVLCAVKRFHLRPKLQ